MGYRRRDWVFAGLLLSALVLPLPFAIRCIIVVATVAVALTLAESWWERREAVSGGAWVLVFVSGLYERFEGPLSVLFFVWLCWTLWRTRRARRSDGVTSATSAAA